VLTFSCTFKGFCKGEGRAYLLRANAQLTGFGGTSPALCAGDFFVVPLYFLKCLVSGGPHHIVQEGTPSPFFALNWLIIIYKDLV